MKSSILINQKKFYLPLHKSLSDLGLNVLDEDWSPSKESLRNVIACFVGFSDVLDHPFKIYKLKRVLSKYNIPIVSWNRDAPHYMNKPVWKLHLLDYIKLIDIYATHTLIDSKRTFGNTVLYLPNATDIENYHLYGHKKEVFTRLRKSSNYIYDVSFFGGMDGNKYKEDIGRQNFFKLLAMKLKRHNVKYKFIETGKNPLSITEQVDLIQSSKINLSYGARCEYSAPVASGLPERHFGIPACGGFLLSDKRTHLPDIYDVGEQVGEFVDVDDCVTKIKYYLAEFSKTRDMAELAYTHVMKNHTYINRAELLIDAVYNWRSKY